MGCRLSCDDAISYISGSKNEAHFAHGRRVCLQGQQGMRTMRAIGFFTIVTTVNLLFGTATASRAQTPEPDTREAAVEQAQREKARNLHPYVPGRTEQLITKASNAFANPTTKWHPYFQNAYRGGGFALGAGYMQHVSAYNFVDVRGSYSVER